ncbi:GNAT family N-acetyltransferase [Butyrivibrio sp. LC3010]|uniref:GNAT family N-acetyltransferase n=1 Tax=Butyrivibrio sp. LC3010 TaxID=1280680 RepID=UPI00040FA7CD|nr:GNAT family N-acetyltransferase [Butyrivibrio sp. LC3010]
MYNFRILNKADDKALAAIIRSNLKNHKLDIPGTVYFDDGLDHLSEFYGTEDKKYYVLEDEKGNLVGGIGYAKFPPMEDTAELQKLYLADSAKGEGLGYKMISYVEERMKEYGFRKSYLETHDNLQAAIHIYQKSGYKEIERPKEVVHSAMNRFFLKDM